MYIVISAPVFINAIDGGHAGIAHSLWQWSTMHSNVVTYSTYITELEFKFKALERLSEIELQADA